MTSVTSHLAPLTNAFHAWIEEIEPNPFQPRVYFDKKAMEELRDSIAVDGVWQPILLRPVPESDLRYLAKQKDGIKFQIIAGERRWRASIMAGKAQIPAIVLMDINDIKMREIAFDENVKSESLTDYEEAVAIMDIWKAYEETEGKISKNQVAKRRKVSVTFISNRESLVLTKPDVQAVAQKHRGVISSCLLINNVSDTDLRSSLLKQVEAGASFRTVESIIAKAKEDAAWKRDSQRAPDKETRDTQSKEQQRQAQARREVEESLATAERALMNAKAWLDDNPALARDEKISARRKKLRQLL